MDNPYPDRDLEELYLEHSSIWDEVAAEEFSIDAALEYMRVLPYTYQWDRVAHALQFNNPPL